MATANETVECVYCYCQVPADETVPPVGDDAAWAELAREHADDCEWVLTRAHRLDLPKE
jgi:hypothetical protein